MMIRTEYVDHNKISNMTYSEKLNILVILDNVRVPITINLHDYFASMSCIECFKIFN